MKTKVQKWGNSLGVRIPKALGQEVGMEEGTPVDIKVERGRLVVSPQRPNKYNVKEIVDQITPKNRHEEFDFGPPQGKEIW